MGFTISIQVDYVDVDTFYPSEGWEKYVTDEKDKNFWDKCFNATEDDEELIEEIRDMAEQDFMMMDAASATIEVDDERIENPFTTEEYELPSPVSMLRRRLRREDKTFKMEEMQGKKFLYLKVWENGGEFRYEGDGDFDLEKLTYNSFGCFEYDGNDFEFIGGDGSSSYEYFWSSGGERIL